MNLLQVIILSILEGLTEFLPISSTAHIIIAQKLMGLTEVNEFFTVIIQFGALLAAILFFQNRIISILKTSLENLKTRNLKNDFGFKLLIGIIPTLVLAFIFKDKLAQLQNSLWVIAISSMLFGFVFYGIEKVCLTAKSNNTQQKSSFVNLLIMGIAQGLSIIPGVSRSGVTVASGLTQEFDFKGSIEISFLMGIPVMLVATIYEIYKSMHSFTPAIITNTAIGMGFAFITGWLGIRIALGLLKKKGFLPFLIYRILFGIFVIALIYSL